VLLEDQDRSRWDADAIAEGCRLAAAAVTGPPGPYGLQAAIAALHAEAADWEATDWRQIEQLYQLLRVQVPSPVVALAHGPTAGLALLEPLADPLAGHHLFHSARGALLMRASRPDEALEAYQRALDRVGTAPERRFLEGRIRELSS
jgi:RNA polymerase sigma-70 factor (ECF subfamily)